MSNLSFEERTVTHTECGKTSAINYTNDDGDNLGFQPNSTTCKHCKKPFSSKDLEFENTDPA
jgi:hypothetical protein